MDLGSLSRYALALLPVCVPTAASAVASGRRASDAAFIPRYNPTTRGGPGLNSGRGSTRVLPFAARSRKTFYYIKLEDEEPHEVAGGPSDDGPPARLRQRPEARPET